MISHETFTEPAEWPFSAPHPMTLTRKTILPGLIAFCSVLLLSNGVAQNSVEAAAFQEAEDYYAAGMAQKDRYEKSRYMTYVVGLYVRYLERFAGSPNEVAARFHLGYARQTLGQITAARETYRLLISRHRRGAYVGSAARQMAYLAFVEERWEEAATYFSVAADNLADQNLRYVARTKEVECFLKLSKTNEAISALRQILDTPKHPHKDWARFLLGYQYFHADKYKATLAILKPLIAPDSTSQYRSQAIFYTGLASAELGNEEAQDSHLRAILDMPMNHSTLTREQRRHLATNKAKAQTSLMGLYTRKKDWLKVIRLYERGDFGATGQTEARRSMRAGNAYLNLRQYREARACFRRVDRALPETESAFQASFQCLVCDHYLRNPTLSERIDIFMELYAVAFADHPNLHQARFLQGEAHFNRRDMEGAAKMFNAVDKTKLAPNVQKELLFKHGWSLGASGQFNGAIRSFTQLIADFPNHPQLAAAQNKRGEAYLSLGDSVSALRDFEAVLALETSAEQTAFALQGSARVLQQEKNYETMIGRYRRILAEFPNLKGATIAHANYRIGWGYHKLERFTEAPPYLRKARDLSPQFYSQPVGDLLILGAFQQRDANALNQALQEVFRQAPAKVIPRHMLSWLGVQLFHEGETSLAASYLERATVGTKPGNEDLAVWRMMAKAQNRSGAYQKAEETSLLVLAQKQEPRWQADAYLDLAEACLGLKKLPEAQKATEEGLALKVAGPHLAGLHLVSAEVSATKKQWEKALQEFRTTISMVPDDPLLQPRALYGGLRAATEMGRDDLAATYRNRLVNSFPNWKPNE